MVYKAAASRIVYAPFGPLRRFCVSLPPWCTGGCSYFRASIDPGIGRRFERAIQFPAARVGEAGACRGGHADPRTFP